jgi:type IV pilus assembly protein PilV
MSIVCASRPPKSQAGFSLIEALISVLILALGLLGTLGMIVNSLKLASSSAYRTVASQQAYSMADQVRGTPLAMVVDTGNDSFDTYSSSATLTADCLKAGGCVRNHVARAIGGCTARWGRDSLSGRQPQYQCADPGGGRDGVLVELQQ